MRGNYILLLLSGLILSGVSGFSQNDKDTLFNNMGVSVSPSSMHLSIKPGSSVSKEIRVKNDTKIKYSFQVGFNDFEMGTNGKPISINPIESKYALSKWTTVSPSYFELNPGEDIKLKMIVTIPDEEGAYVAAWTIVTIEQVTERPPLDDGSHPNRLSMGVLNSFGFGIYLYQNPPNVILNKLDIFNF